MMNPAMIELVALPPVHAVAVIPETEACSFSSTTPLYKRRLWEKPYSSEQI